MYRNKKFEKRYFILAIMLLLVIVLSISAFALKNNRNLNAPEKVLKDTSVFTIKIVTSPFTFVKKKIDNYHEYKTVLKKYKNLKAKADKYDALKAENHNLQNEIKKLKEISNISTIISNQAYLNASVIYRNVGYWYSSITIDKGSKQGVKSNMPVVVNDGLIGVTTKVSYLNTTVKLLTSQHLSDKISVKIRTNNTYVYGLLSGYNTKTKTYTVEGISENTTVQNGDEVVTTGMSETFPSGLYIGKVSGYTTDNFDLSKEIKVKSNINFDDIDYVTILKRNNQ